MTIEQIQNALVSIDRGEQTYETLCTWFVESIADGEHVNLSEVQQKAELVLLGQRVEPTPEAEADYALFVGNVS